MSGKKENFVIELIQFFMNSLATGNEKVDKMIRTFISCCILGTILLFVLSLFLGVVGDTMPYLLEPLGSFLGAALDWGSGLFGSGTADIPAVNQSPIPLSDVPMVPAS